MSYRIETRVWVCMSALYTLTVSDTDLLAYAPAQVNVGRQSLDVRKYVYKKISHESKTREISVILLKMYLKEENLCWSPNFRLTLNSAAKIHYKFTEIGIIRMNIFTFIVLGFWKSDSSDLQKTSLLNIK